MQTNDLVYITYKQADKKVKYTRCFIKDTFSFKTQSNDDKYSLQKIVAAVAARILI